MRSWLLMTAVLLFAPTGPAQRQDQDGPRRELDSVKLEHFTVQQLTFPAGSLERVWGEYGAYLPKDYDRERKEPYPWAIWLHGMGGDWRQFHRHGAPVLDRLRGEGKLPAMILIAPTAGGRSLYFNGERTGDYEDLIVRDLRDEIEQRFAVSKRREDRAVMGISSGGFGALRIALKYREVFGSVAAHSAPAFPLDPNDLSERYQRQAEFLGRSLGLDQILGNPIEPERWAREIPTAILAKLAPAELAGLRIHFDVGTQDRYGFGPANSELHDLLQSRGIEHSFELIEGGGHSWGSGFDDETLAKSLQFVAAGFTSGK